MPLFLVRVTDPDNGGPDEMLLASHPTKTSADFRTEFDALLTAIMDADDATQDTNLEHMLPRLAESGGWVFPDTEEIEVER